MATKTFDGYLVYDTVTGEFIDNEPFSTKALASEAMEEYLENDGDDDTYQERFTVYGVTELTYDTKSERVSVTIK